MKRGKFITIEGGDGSGKTTQIENIVSYLEEHKIDVVRTREPGGTVFGEEMRKLILGSNMDMSYLTQAMLMFAARHEHLIQVILPALEKERWVVCDRFTDSTFAYQGIGHKVPFYKLEMLDFLATGSFKPDLTIYLDVGVETGKKRSSQTGEDKDRFETQLDDFKQRVRDYYLSLANGPVERVKLVDAEKSLEEVADQVNDVLGNFIEENS